ncbi:MAG: serine/threonine-protein kinase [Sumerlaeia bacterium]
MMTAADPSVEAWLPSQYHDPALVGGGGQADVWRARARSGPSPVAIKRYKKNTPRGVFYRELAMLAEVRSPHVVEVYDLLDSPAGDLLLVMEYCAGGNLRDALESDASPTYGEALRLASQVALGLHDIHGRGLIHGDIKPENLFRLKRTGPPEWKIADFGVSEFAHARGNGCRFYTPAYAAPEQKDQRIFQSSDIYAWAVVLAECLLGRLPWEEPEPLMENQRPPAFDSLEGLPPDLRDLLFRCLEERPSLRPDALACQKTCARCYSFWKASAYCQNDLSQVFGESLFVDRGSADVIALETEEGWKPSEEK